MRHRALRNVDRGLAGAAAHSLCTFEGSRGDGANAIEARSETDGVERSRLNVLVDLSPGDGPVLGQVLGAHVRLGVRRQVPEARPLLAGSLDIDLPPASLFSVAGFTALEGLDIGNVRYPLTDFALAFGSSRTISNVANGGPVHFSLKSGKAIVLARPYDLTGA